ncbi:hypothetical protein GOBAR_AA07397 [Gossypium barbadense]|uniref:Zinc knuckle CX2CX4HX4C domain-containing protein n=1 Tax=Gossypium barbadense TaxID=3634 RepID=A0A2P5YCF1_GOSBA|nr:hypothetical protein GOBAR_AA07397 [Gossypium barbadense]
MARRSCALAAARCYLWATMVEDINAQLGKLNFSEEESKRVFSLKLKSNDTQGQKTWVIEKIMGQEFEAFTFNISPFWVRVFNIHFHHMDREEAIKVGRAIGEVAVIDWHYKDGGWVNYIRLRVKIDVLKPFRRVVHLVDRDGTKIDCAIKYERLLVFFYICSLIGHSTKKYNRKEK